ncbi:HIT domain-containing protein [candidate division WOR-3 bacterium]|nr:HIT domain-containing protein [candidate division WOR-3 bacterium]
MKRLWAPWRGEYIRTAVDQCRSGMRQCFFCRLLAENDDEANLVLVRGRGVFVVMNRYPYNNGHLMVAPNRHVGDYERLTATEHAEIARLVRASIRALRLAMKPHGYNIGMNLGRAAGAGVIDHLHVHVVPRWNGDANFMPTLAGTKVIGEHLHDTWRALRPLLRVRKGN